MANYKQVNVIDRIYQLYKQGFSQRRIASELGLSRNTVGRYLSQKPGAPVQGGSVSNDATHGVAQFEATRGNCYRHQEMSVLGRISCAAYLKECDECAKLLAELEQDDTFVSELQDSIRIFKEADSTHPQPNDSKEV